MMGWVSIILFGLCAFLLLSYAVYQCVLSLSSSSQEKRRLLESGPKDSIDFKVENASVTFQIALYNEGHTVDGLFQSIIALDYPKDLIEIQVLDDSTDGSDEINAQWVKQLQVSGLKAHHLKRSHRDGYKAGALNAGLQQAKGNYIAFFDADFRFSPDWLNRSLKGFTSDQLAAVQTRWVYLNNAKNWITKIQPLALNHHFINEHLGREKTGAFTTFNGTAALWEKSAIETVQGFNTETLTEDLNIAYRAQLAGYQIKYYPNITADCELPESLAAYFSQQFRWNKGAAENFQLLKSSLRRLRGRKRFHALMHLLGSSFYAVTFALFLIGLVLPFMRLSAQQIHVVSLLSPLLLVASLSLGVALYRADRDLKHSSSSLDWVVNFLGYLIVSAGMSYLNTKAVFEGHLRKPSAFIRTPKEKQLRWKSSRALPVVEVLITVLSSLSVFMAFETQQLALIGMPLFTTLAFAGVSFALLKGI
jgi:cellulose synthase/poly-beta-1,6-N-acetylglucosamine synthase-like glycosyltransferase